MCGRKSNARERYSELSVYGPSHRTQRFQRSFHFLTVGFEMSSTVVSYSFVSPWRLEDVVASGRSSAWTRAGALVWRVWRMQYHGDVLYRLEWRIVIAHKECTGRSFVGPFPTKWISKAVPNLRFCRRSVSFSGLWGEIRDALNPNITESGKHCLYFWLDLPSWRRRLPLWWHLLRLRAVAINRYVTSNSNAGQVGGFICGTLEQLAARCYHAANCCDWGRSTWLATESTCHPLLRCAASEHVAKCAAWLLITCWY